MVAPGGVGSRGGDEHAGWDERRTHQRVSVTAQVWLGQGGVFTRGQERLTNLSLGGAFIEFEGRYQTGTVFDLRIALDGQFINSTVIVRRALADRGAGVQFLDLSPESRERLEAFLARQVGSEGRTDDTGGFGHSQ